MTTTQKQEVKAGQIYYTSWGYDQTNYDYIGVLSISKTGKTCKCQRVASKHISSQYQCNEQKPVFEPFGDIFTMRIKDGYFGNTVLKGSYPFCHDGSMKHKRLDSFSLCEENSTYFETMSEFGH